MAPSSPPEAPVLDPDQAAMLLDVADEAIAAGLHGHRPGATPLAGLPEALRSPGAAFVTLTVDGALNGCIGAIEPEEPLAACVAHNAYAAAFEDPRLPRLRSEQLDRLHVEVSLLSPLQPVPATTRSELLAQIRPGIDGLLIGAASRRAVFLPSVWEQLPDPDEFVDHLLRKAGLRTDGWPADMRAWRFTSKSYGRNAVA